MSREELLKQIESEMASQPDSKPVYDGIPQDSYQEPTSAGVIREQLDLGEDLVRIDYLLRGYTLEIDQKGNQKWTAPSDENQIILSDYGVNLIRNAMGWYMNKNTLLSNYDDKTILEKMEDFAESLADDIFMEYENVFFHPTFNKCKEELNKRIQNKVDIRKYASEIVGLSASEEEIKNKILKEMEPRIERELENIKAKLMKDKLKRFELIMRQVQDAVHSTYQRAWRGEERRSLRQHMHVSETKGGVDPYAQEQKKGGYNPFNWGKS